jgi:hypothetical protein
MSIFNTITDVKKKYSSTGALNAVKTVFNTQNITVNEQNPDNVIVSIEGIKLNILLVTDYDVPDDSCVVLKCTEGRKQSLIINCLAGEIDEMKRELSVAHLRNPNITRKNHGN